MGDYDGDQVTVKILWTQEANEEIEGLMKSKSFFMNTAEKFIRYVELEAIQTFYNMTKQPGPTNKRLNAGEAAAFIIMDPKEITFEFLTSLFGHLEKNKGQAKYEPEDILTIPKNGYEGNREPIETTIGTLMFNKILYQGTGLSKELGYINQTMTEKAFFGIEEHIGELLLVDKFNTDQMYQYVDTRDWLGLQFHAMITPSFSPATIKIHPEVQKLKDELFKKYKKELDDGDAIIAAKIEKELIAKTEELFKDDPGMDLYNSGARGSISNNYKNIALMRGAVYNRATKKYEIVKNSLNDGLDPKDIPVSSNTILEGAYPKACGTRDSGYIAKQLLASCQTEILDEPGTDCHTKRGIRVELTKDNKKRYLHRYIMQDKKPLLLTAENIDSFVGKTVEIRSPMTCVKTEKGCICNVCAGNFYYMIGNPNIGLSASRIGNDLSKMNMKKFHDNVVKFSLLSPDDDKMLI